VLDLATNKLTSFASNLPKGTESLARASDGKLLGGVSNNGKTALFVYDIATKQVTNGVLPLNSPFKSVEGLCVPSSLLIQ
jgi:hypothetical protein